MDLDTVQSRLDKGIYCDCHPKFYRDLLLIFTNAVLFYRKSSAEHIAARELRKLVIDEVTQKTRKPKVQQRKPDPEPQPLEPVVKKPRSSTTMVVCRRRSSSSMQALSDSIKKGDTSNVTTISKNDVSEKVENGRDEKIKPSHHQKKVVNGNDNGNSNKNSSNNNSESPSIKKEKGSGGGVSDGNLKKLLTRERSNLGNGGLRLSSNNGKKIISKDGSKNESSDGEGAGVLEKKKINNTELKQEKGGPIVLKKQGVADFLKRMKQNSPSSQEKAKNNGSEEEENENEEKGGRKEKISSANNNNVKKTSGNLKKNVKEVEAEVGTTRRSSGRRVETEAAASRRGIGRPPKRKAAMMSSNTNTPDSAKGGRSVIKDGGETLKKKPRR
ncbi:Transcription factor GTE9 [Bienertia sinuspersici]